MEISFLCKVVDNFGDIGVIWRICLSLQKYLSKNDSINLIIDDLNSFNKICKSVDISKTNQIINNIKVYNWNNYNFCYDEFSNDNNQRLQVILEMFQCGRPDWLEKILFQDSLNHPVQIIMVDYLTAEKYAEDFHKLQSLTRKALVKKINFMPGFTEKTGGLTLGENWQFIKNRNSNGNILFFTYDKNWDNEISAIKKFLLDKKSNKKLLIPQGIGKDSIIKSSKKYSLDFIELSYINQNQWDIMMQESSFLFIRGEDSMSRACLSGIPFIWHAYPQSENYQLVKVKALLERMKIHFKENDFPIIEKAWISINSPEEDFSPSQRFQFIYDFLNMQEDLLYGFRDFAESLINNGDLSLHLLEFIREIWVK